MKEKTENLAFVEKVQVGGDELAMRILSHVTAKREDYTCPSSEESVDSFFVKLTKTYSATLSKEYEKLGSWELGEMYFTTGPDYEAQIEKEIEKLKPLTEHTPRYDFSLLVPDRHFNASLAGVLLKVLQPFPEKQKSATVALGRIRWLTERLDKDTKTCTAMPLPSEDEDAAMLRSQIDELKLDEKKKERYPLLYALKEVWHERGRPWAQNNSKFAEKIAPILKQEFETVKRGLNRACKTIRIKGSDNCYPLSTLRKEEIDIRGEQNKIEELDKWRNRYTMAKSIMSRDTSGTCPEDKHDRKES